MNTWCAMKSYPVFYRLVCWWKTQQLLQNDLLTQVLKDIREESWRWLPRKIQALEARPSSHPSIINISTAVTTIVMQMFMFIWRWENMRAACLL